MPQPLRARFVPYESLPGNYQDVRDRVPDTTKARRCSASRRRSRSRTGLHARSNGIAHVARPGWLLKRETPTSPPRRHRGRSLRIVVRCGGARPASRGPDGHLARRQGRALLERDGRGDRVLRLPRDDCDLDHDPGHTGRRSGGHLVHRHAARERDDVLLRRPLGRGRRRIGELAGRPGDARSRVRARPATRRARELLPGHDAAGTCATRRRSRPAGSRATRTSPSIDKGGSVDLKVNVGDAATFRIEIYRTGYYGGAGARLFSTIRGVPGTAQPACSSDDNTGLLDCSNWSISRDDHDDRRRGPRASTCCASSARTRARDNQILLIVRDDCAPVASSSTASPISTFQAYNNYGGKSLYDFNSIGTTTVAGTAARGQGLVRPAVRAAAVRPARLVSRATRSRPSTGSSARATTSRTSRTPTSTRTGSRLLGHKAYISPAHDEYWSAGMRSALTTARDAGVNLFFTGSNEIYWKIRFENSPSRPPDRVEVCYKSTQSGGADPSGIPTGTWRDPPARTSRRTS